ncbi:thiamine phosphate synthase [Acetobacter sp. LMG 1627]|uniref:Thiamine phosphate synthase n=2 Tax=Acetobacter conturbans TaxID=1737472 RepID=A0ABX0K2H9_9PROT|nr:thiamine phosphate synthase [Acetobacter conturbans]NHN88222.1 thiamine phosphate synthase [Acetobacter conturbans]
MREPCQAYLVTPLIEDPAPFLPALRMALQALPVAAVRLRLPPSLSGQQMRETISMVRDLVQSHGAALMLEGQPKLARDMSCDGAHVAPEDVKEARRILGEELQLGTSCGISRDDAMRAGEAGVDYIAFGVFDEQPNPEGVALVRWWREMMELAVVAECFITPTDDSIMAASALMEVADFLAIGMTSEGETNEAFWQAPDQFAKLFEGVPTP